MKDIKCFVFDFGNVVAFFDHRKACRQLAGLTNKRWSAAEIYQKIFRAGGLESQYDRGKLTTEEFVGEVKKRFEIRADEADIKVAWCDIFWLNESMFQLLRRLKEKSFKLILASNTNELHHQWFKEKFKEELRYFEKDFVLSHEIGHRKPDPEFFARCIEAAGCHASQCVYVDDREDFVTVACEMGMNGIVVDDLIYRLPEFGIVDNPSSEKFGVPLRRETMQATNLAIYKEKYANFRHFDTLRWQIPGLVFVVGGAILIGAPRGDGVFPGPWFLFLYGLFVILCARLMGRIGYHMKRNTKVLGSIARRIGDRSIPVPPGRTGAAYSMEKFIWVLGIGALVGGGWFKWRLKGAVMTLMILGAVFAFHRFVVWWKARRAPFYL